MMNNDFDDADSVLVNSRPDHLYNFPTKDRATGAYVRLITEGEELIDFDITERCRLALSLFYNAERQDYTTLVIKKMRRHGAHWRPEGEIRVNRTERRKLTDFLALMLSLEPSTSAKTRIAVDALDMATFGTLLATNQGSALLAKIANSPNLTEDVFALAHKRGSLDIFGSLLNEDGAVDAYKRKHDIRRVGPESAWQHFFEANSWIFGHGLNYVFLDKVAKKLETTTTGASFMNPGDRIDALMRTKAAVSQFVLIEIKTPGMKLLGRSNYRSGCWGIDADLTDAISQVQKTAYDFIAEQTSKVQLRTEDGWQTGKEVYRIRPRTYLIAGSLEQMRDHDDMITSFELFRSSLMSPEILTFDELYERAKCIVATISAEPPLSEKAT